MEKWEKYAAQNSPASRRLNQEWNITYKRIEDIYANKFLGQIENSGKKNFAYMNHIVAIG